MNKITELLNNNFFTNLVKYQKILGITNFELDKAFVHNKWIGTNLCGPSSVICYYLLLCNTYENVRVYTNTILCKEYCEDHTFLIYNNIIIDPTINQFLNNPINDNFYIGDYERLNNLIKNNSELYNLELWEKKYDITKNVNKFIKKSLKD